MLTYLQNPEKIRERPRVETTEDMPTDMNFCQMPQQLGAEEQDGLCERLVSVGKLQLDTQHQQIFVKASFLSDAASEVTKHGSIYCSVLEKLWQEGDPAAKTDQQSRVLPVSPGAFQNQKILTIGSAWDYEETEESTLLEPHLISTQYVPPRANSDSQSNTIKQLNDIIGSDQFFTQASSNGVCTVPHQTEKPYTESQFGNIVSLNPPLMDHEINFQDKPVEYTGCGKVFTGETAFCQQQITNSMETSFICHTCGKTFLHKSKLTSHSETPREETPYECPDCAKSEGHN